MYYSNRKLRKPSPRQFTPVTLGVQRARERERRHDDDGRPKSPSVQPQSQQQLIVSPETTLSMQRRSRRCETFSSLLCAYTRDTINIHPLRRRRRRREEPEVDERRVNHNAAQNLNHLGFKIRWNLFSTAKIVFGMVNELLRYPPHPPHPFINNNSVQ